MAFRADLHCHSTCSDGTCTPELLVQKAAENGLKGLVITDHDTVAAYPAVFVAAKEAGVRMVAGVEFSTDFEGTSIHLLGYSFAPGAPEILELCRRHEKRRLERNRAILAKLKDHGMEIDEESLARAGTTVGRPHIAFAMMEKGYVSSIQEAFKKWIGDQCPCYAVGQVVSSKETIEAIHRSRGFAILAHPHLINRRRVVTKLLELPFDGIECYYARMTPKQEEPWVKIAAHRNLIKTGGSDFHGDVKPAIALGSSWVGEETFALLEERFRDNVARISTAP